MSIICSDANSCHQDNFLALVPGGDPFSRLRTHELETKIRYGSENDPQRPPKPKPGDIYVTIGAIIGLIVGGALGAIIGNHYSGSIGLFIGLTGGMIIFGIIGATIGNIVKKRRQNVESNT